MQRALIDDIHMTPREASRHKRTDRKETRPWDGLGTGACMRPSRHRGPMVIDRSRPLRDAHAFAHPTIRLGAIRLL